MYDVYVTTISSLIKESYACVLKGFTTLPEVKQLFQKNLPIIGDFPLC
jgi:hypothetical protein